MPRRSKSKTDEDQAFERWCALTDRLRAEGALLIDVNLQGDGAVYGLDPSAERLLENAPPNTPRPRCVVIGHYRDSEFMAINQPHWPQIVEMLTGLTLEQLKPFAPIYITSPTLGRIVWEWNPEAVRATG
jgi:hypothetical protein